MTGPTEFTVDVAEEDLEDLRRRLERARVPDEVNDDDWTWGTDRGYLLELVEYWRDGFDWRAQEARLNAFAQHVVPVDGCDVHVLGAPGRTSRRVPLLLTHGWPGSVAEMLDVLPILTGADGALGQDELSFDVVVPSIPGFGFSSVPAGRALSTHRVAEVLHELMIGLGHERFVVQGGDVGSGVSQRIAFHHPGSVIGMHVNFPSFGYDAGPHGPAESEAVRAADRRRRTWWEQEGAYAHLHMTRPQTVGYALDDSPIGLAAWIVEKFYRWSDHTASPGRPPFSMDDLLTDVSIYWFTRTITSSMRLYRENAADPLVLGGDRRIDVPCAVAAFPHEIPAQPRERAERVMDLRRWTEMPRGGHFAALEEPALLAADLRAHVEALVD